MRRILLNDRFILLLILLNALIVFIQSFEGLPISIKSLLFIFDIALTSAFILEIILKIKQDSFRGFFLSGWNKFDFSIIFISALSLIISFTPVNFDDLSFILILRLTRVFKAFRFLKFIPNIDDLIKGVNRALKASVLVLFALIVYNFILSVISFYLFKDVAPEYFGNPLQAIYSIFKIFTVEGWYEIPDTISKNTSSWVGYLSVIYFILILISGGIFGLSLVNSIFVDAMVADNNNSLEENVNELTERIKDLTIKIEQLTKKH